MNQGSYDFFLKSTLDAVVAASLSLSLFPSPRGFLLCEYRIKGDALKLLWWLMATEFSIYADGRCRRVLPRLPSLAFSRAAGLPLSLPLSRVSITSDALIGQYLLRENGSVLKEITSIPR